MSEDEYVGKKVAVMVPAQPTLPEAEVRPDAVSGLQKACTAKGLQATDITLVWHGSWAEAIARGTVDALYSDCTNCDDLIVYLYEATAREGVSA